MSVTKLAGLAVSDSLGGAESVSRAAQETRSPVRPLMCLRICVLSRHWWLFWTPCYFNCHLAAWISFCLSPPQETG